MEHALYDVFGIRCGQLLHRFYYFMDSFSACFGTMSYVNLTFKGQIVQYNEMLLPPEFVGILSQ